MKILYTYILISIVFLSCNTKRTDSSVYIGGEIINPHSNFVLLMKNETIVDSLFLNSDNSFGKRISKLNSGLYSFKHGYEFQYIYIDPYDSIKIRLNTWDFDETIVFEGKGAAKNELLINLFLENEKEYKNFFSYFSLKESDFQDKINTTYRRQKKQIDFLLSSESNISEAFLHIANAAINYPLYRLKELYPYYHKKALQSNEPFPISKEFYKYRKSINLNDPALSDFHAYQSFVTTYLYNLAYHRNGGKMNTENFYPILLKLISDSITNQTVKNRLLEREIDQLFINKPEFINTQVLAIFNQNNTDSITRASLKEALLKKETLQVNNSFPDFEVKSAVTGKNQSIHALTKNKKAVIYFWSSNTVSNEYLNKRISYLTKKHPKITFIGINSDSATIVSNSCPSKLTNQYYLTSTSKGKNLISNKYPRAILINSKGKVSNSFTVLTSYCLDEQIKEITDK